MARTRREGGAGNSNAPGRLRGDRVAASDQSWRATVRELEKANDGGSSRTPARPSAPRRRPPARPHHPATAPATQSSRRPRPLLEGSPNPLAREEPGVHAVVSGAIEPDALAGGLGAQLRRLPARPPTLRA